MDRPTLVWRSRKPITVAFGVAAAALVAGLFTFRSGASTLRGLPPDQRAAVAQRTLANLHDLCRGPARPREFCREQAQLVLELPECGAGCRAQARAELWADSAVK